MKTVCPQCHTDGYHKMSCTDESNPTRKDRANVPATVREPIVESQMEHVHPQMLKQLKERAARCTELEKAAAEVVAELRERSSEANRLSALGYGDAPSYHTGRDNAFDAAADFVAEKLGVES